MVMPLRQISGIHSVSDMMVAHRWVEGLLSAPEKGTRLFSTILPGSSLATRGMEKGEMRSTSSVSQVGHERDNDEAH
jgi:hypothetical protein